MSRPCISAEGNGGISLTSNQAANPKNAGVAETASRERTGSRLPSTRSDAADAHEAECKEAKDSDERSRQGRLKIPSQKTSNRPPLPSLHRHLQQLRNRRITNSLLVLYLILVVLMLSQMD